MRSKWQKLGSIVALLALATGLGFAQGKGKGHEKDKHGEGKGDDRHYYSDNDRGIIRRWCNERGENLPPGLAKRDRLPPGLEKQLRERGTLPPGLQKRMYDVPEDLERRLPPPPSGCRHVIVGGHVLIINVKTRYVYSIFHIELP